MKYKHLFFGLVFGLSAFHQSSEAVHVLTEAKAGYFYPTSSHFRDIYSGGGIYGLEISCQAWKGLYPWVSGSYFYQTGHSIGSHSRTSITLAPIGIGLKYIFDINKYLNFYIGFGGTATYLHIHDRSPYVIKSISKWGGGGIVKSGFFVNVTDSFFIDIYSDYSFITVDFNNKKDEMVTRNNADISGVSFGGGLGYRF